MTSTLTIPEPVVSHKILPNQLSNIGTQLRINADWDKLTSGNKIAANELARYSIAYMLGHGEKFGGIGKKDVVRAADNLSAQAGQDKAQQALDFIAQQVGAEAAKSLETKTRASTSIKVYR